MSKYLRNFQSHSDYNTYINGQNKLLPNVSYCKNENEVHYNPWTDPKLVCKYNITDTSSATALRSEYEPNMFKSMEIDGVLLDSLVTEYQFSTTGEHTVKYELYDETKVGNQAPLFLNITSLTSVSIPNSVTTIGNNAFNSCTGLTSITIPNGITSIGNYAFVNCGGILSVTLNSNFIVSRNYSNNTSLSHVFGSQVTEYIIGNSVTSIGTYAFDGCTGLTTITIPNSVTSISDRAFQSCTGLTNITIPSSVASIGDYAFSDCTSLTNVTIGSGVTSIGDYAFQYCTGLTNITIPSSVASIGDYAFVACSGLTSITVDSNNNVYDSRNNCNAIIETSNNTLIQGCKNTVIPNSVTSIGDYAFQRCSNLTNITIPNSVTYIEEGAFSDCTSLTNVTIGSGVTSIGDYAFYACYGLTSITSLATTAPAIQTDTFQNVKTGGTLYVPSGSTGYDTWMGTGDYYLGLYNWTKVEQ